MIFSSLFAIGLVAAGFLIMAVGKAVIVIAFAGMACLIGYGITLGNYRSGQWPFWTTLLIGFATFFASNIGSHSLWLTAYGETLHCKVISIDAVPSRTSPTTYKNKLQCGDRQLEYHPSMYRSAQKPGTEMDIAVDKTGVVPDLEPDKVTPERGLLLLLALLMNGALIFLIAWLPIRDLEPAAEEETT